MSSKPFQFHKDFEVRSYQVHPSGKLSLTALADLFQEIAWLHADSADFGRNLSAQQQSWILSRIDIKCVSLPSWGDPIHVYTTGRGVDKLFAFREFLVTNPQGKVLATAISSWVLMNMESRKLLRPEQVLPATLFDPLDQPDYQPERIRIKGELIYTEKLKVRYSDLDLNDHVNNTSYIRWVENILCENNCMHDNTLINYVAECTLGDELEISLWKNNEEYLIRGTVEEKAVFHARTKALETKV